MRSECPPIGGRDHLAYRSYYFPIRNVIDGDLCEMYNSLDSSKQKTIAEELERLPSEVCCYHPLRIIPFNFVKVASCLFFQVSKKLEDIRTRYAF